MRATVLAAALLLVCGCDSAPTLSVRVQSGLRAGLDLTRIDVSIHRGAVACPPVGASVGGGGANLAVTDDLAAGLPVAELVLAPDTYTIHATGQVADRTIRRCVVVTLTSSRVVRVPLSVSCLDVQCPAPTGSAAFNECLNGRCVDPRCDPDDPSTAELCCDRAVLGEACDDDPTLCRASTDCETTLGCAGAPACAQGVCVEPVEDACAEGTYCSAETATCEPWVGPGIDAGVRDAASPADAFVPPGADAPFPDAFREPDAVTSSDAFVPPGADAPFPDAFEASDAFVAADAPFSGEEDCSLAGDEDGVGGADCMDPACFTHIHCTHPGCPPYTPTTPPTAPIPTPTHWYRGDYGRLTGLRTDVCGWRDIVGDAHLFYDDLVVRGGSLGGELAITFDDRRRLVIDDENLGITQSGDFSVFVVAQRSGTMGTMTVLRSWLPSVMHEVFSTSHAAGSGSFGVEVRGNGYTLGDVPTTDPLRESFVVGSLIRASSIAAQVEYRRQGVVVPLVLQSGSDSTGAASIAAPAQVVLGGAGTVTIAEILVYDHALTMAERVMVETYLEGRYDGSSS